MNNRLSVLTLLRRAAFLILTVSGILGTGCILVAGCTCYLQAQSLYIPRNIVQAYKNGTRSMDGRPGKHYWQNYGRYAIALTAQPPDRTVHGVEEIAYYNNSPDTLR